MAEAEDPRRREDEDKDEDGLDEIDEESLESFPASDPPSSSSPLR
jgi:hypothetical protein